MPSIDSVTEMAREERDHLRPGIRRSGGAMALGVREVQERVPGAVVAMKLVHDSVLGERGVDAIDIGGRRIRVVVAEEADHRTLDLRRAIDRRRATGGPRDEDV